MDFTKYIFKLRGTEMEAICFEGIGENIGGYIKNIIILNRKVSEKFRRISSFPLKKIVLLLVSRKNGALTQYDMAEQVKLDAYHRIPKANIVHRLNW